MKNIRRDISDVLKNNSGILLIYAFAVILNLTVFYLYGISVEPFVYSFIISFVIIVIYLTVCVYLSSKRSKIRRRMLNSITDESLYIGTGRNFEEKDYLNIIDRLRKHSENLSIEFNTKIKDTEDYYTAWVHQIKTPISVMRMMLSDVDSDESRALLFELFRVEQYVDMVLQYIRLDACTNDLYIKEYKLDEIIRKSIRKYATQFIGKKLALNYSGTDKIVITDEKYLSVIIEQLLSNAVKYTSIGKVDIEVTDNMIAVSDTGIGIDNSDIPRIFEKGYTGQNGRASQKSSGLGLYLCKKASDKINMPLSVKSKVGIGSTFYIDFASKIHKDMK